MSDKRFERIRSLGGEQYKAFLDAGYGEFWNSGQFRSTPYLLQKRIDRERDQLFFIDVWVYEPRDGHPLGWQTDAQFRLPNDAALDVTYFGIKPTPEDVEAFMRKLYERMECTPYYDPKRDCD